MQQVTSRQLNDTNNTEV